MPAGPIGFEVVFVWALSSLGVLHIVYLFRRFAFKKPAQRKYTGGSPEQLRHVMATNFRAKKIMNFPEYRVFKAVEDIVKSRRDGCRVFSQTSLGEILSGDTRLGHGSINSKRVDVLVVAPNGFPRLVVEYQGTGHYRGDAAARDAVKKEALRKAGVAYLEVPENMSGEDIRVQINAVLDRSAERKAS